MYNSRKVFNAKSLVYSLLFALLIPNLSIAEVQCNVIIGDFVWYDTNQDGIQDGNENGISGIEVELYKEGSKVGLARTNSDGKYLFDINAYGNYYIKFVLPSGYIFSPKEQGVDNSIDSDADQSTGQTKTISINIDGNDFTWDAGMYVGTTPQLASVGDFVWYDGDENGMQNTDGSSVGVDNVTVELFHSGGGSAGTTQTNSNGWYSFANLTPGDYYLKFSNIPNGYVFTYKDQGTNNAIDSDVNPANGQTDVFTLDPGENDIKKDAGIYETANIIPPSDPTCNENTSLLWENNVVINDCDVSTTVRFVRGQTTQYIIPGTYPSAFNGSVDVTITEAVAWDGYCDRPGTGDQPNERFRVVFKKGGTEVWASPYTGGTSDGIDTGVISDEWVGPLGTTFNLPNGADQIILEHWSVDNSWDTNANSVTPSSVCIKYETGAPNTDFGDAPSSYGDISATITGDYESYLGTIADGETGMQHSTNADGDDNNGNDDEDGVAFVGGNTLMVNTTEQTTLSWSTTLNDGHINAWIDFNGDGNFDSNEKIITDHLVGSGSGNSTGSKTFNFIVPADAICGTSYARFLIADNNISHSPTGSYQWGEVEDYKITIDGCTGPVASVGNFVWYDDNKDGKQNTDGSSVGVNNVTVQLFHSGGALAGTTTTNSNGWYEFTNLTPGDYYLKFSNIPSGYVFTYKDQGTNNAIDSDVNPANGQTDVFNLSAGENDMTWDAGIFEAPITHPNCEYLYSVADEGDKLVYLPKDGSTGATAIGPLGVTSVEAITISLDESTLYAANSGTFGTINWNTGAFSSIGSFGTGGGSEGNITFSDVDGLAFDPSTGDLYGTHRRNDGSPEDVLFMINPINGQHVPNVFGSGIDYVRVRTYSAVGLYDVDDIAIDPADGQMYAVINSSGGNDRIVKVDKATGIVTDIGRLHTTSGNLNDMEGLSFHNDGNFYGTTGKNGDSSTNNTTWIINTSTALVTKVHAMGILGDYEAVAGCIDYTPITSIGNFVWYDGDENGMQNTDGSSVGVDNVTVQLFHSGGALAGTTTTNSDGYYHFTNLAPGDYYLKFSNLPAGYVFTDKDQGTDDTIDSDVNPANGQTDVTTLTAGEHDMTWDAGIIETTIIIPPSDPTCDEKTSLLWENNVVINDCDVSSTVRFVNGQTTTYTIPGPYPAAFNGSVDITISEAIAWDGYCNRPGTGNQPNERFRVVFKKNGNIVWSSPYTGTTGGTDGIDTGVISDEWVGPLGTTVNLPNGADEIILVHWSNDAYGEGDHSNANSVVPASVCIGYDTHCDVEIGDYVWWDENHNGEQDDDKLFPVNAPHGINGVRVILYDGNGNYLEETITTNGPTGGSGWYEFINLTPGDYIVAVDPSTVPGDLIYQTYDYDGIDTQHKAKVTLDKCEKNYNLDFGYDDEPLPVTLASFTANSNNGEVILTWVTESEIENQGFILERRTEGNGNWLEIANFTTNPELKGQGTVTYSTTYDFVDRLVQMGQSYEYRLGDVDYDGVVEYHSTRTVEVDETSLSTAPNQFAVKPAYPNPFNPSTVIEYAIPEEGMVNITIYDLMGQKISTLRNEAQTSGWHQVRWNGQDDHGISMPAGVYLISVNAGNSIKTMKLIFVK